VLRDRRPPSWLPWVLCWLSLALLVVGLGVRITHPEGVEDGVLYAGANALSIGLAAPVGALLAARLPANPYGWLWCALGLVFGVLALSDGLRRTSAVPAWVAWELMGSSFPVILCLLVFILLLFPTGRLPGAAWRWLPVTTVVLAAAGVVLLPFSRYTEDIAAPSPWALAGGAGALLGDLLEGGITVMFLLVLPAAAAVLVRFRRAGPIERQQLKWFLLAAGVNAVTIPVDLLGVPISPPVWAVIDAVSVALLPVAVAIAVLRYRLFEVDRIVSRTVSYGLLTGGLIGLYLLVVALLRPLLEPLTGNSTLAVAGSTLVVAAVFDPARRWLQAVVDRRFDRARYDAARAVDAFAARLRDQVDLDQVSAGLRDTVASTVAPTRVAVWLRDVPSTREA
jgi:hypothetical protein